MLSVDEWNVWYHSHGQDRNSPEWSVARPLLEDAYDMADVLVVGGMINALLNRADRVKIACLAQTVNVIAPIHTETGGKAWRHTIFHPFALASRYGRGTALRQVVDSPVYDPKAPVGDNLRQAPYLSSSVIWNAEAGEIAVFAVNRSLDESMALDVTLEKLGATEVIEHLVIADSDLDAVNSADEERVKPKAAAGATLDGETLTVELAPASWNLIRLTTA
jgi:alpha-N-arabinofuranosidase